MENERYSILFSSLTGNTKKLADTLREVLPKEDCDYFGAPEAEVPPSEMLYIGFWTDKGNADSAALELLAKLREQKSIPVRDGGLRRQRGIFSEYPQSCQGIHRPKQFCGR